MFKNKNEVQKLSNMFFLVMGGLSLLSAISLLTNGVDGIKEYSDSDYYFNLIMMIIYVIMSFIILWYTNKKNILYNDEFPITRRAFNFFVMISIMSMVVTITANILNYFLYGNFSLHSLIVMILGYIPAYFIAFKEVCKGELLSITNEPKINVANFLIIYLIMQYYVNIVSMLSGMFFDIDNIVALLSGLCWAFIWICIVVISYKLINKKEEFNLKLKKK